MCSLLNKLALAIKREHLSVIRDQKKKDTILKTVFKLINTSTDDELTIHVLLVLLQVSLYIITILKIKKMIVPILYYNNVLGLRCK